MFFAIVQHVTPQAERAQVSRTIVSRVVIEMRGGQKDFCGEQGWIVGAGLGKSRERPATAIAPYGCVFIPPAAVAKVDHSTTVRAAALFAAPVRPAKSDCSRDLRPVDRVEPAMLRADRHLRILNPASRICNRLRSHFPQEATAATALAAAPPVDWIRYSPAALVRLTRNRSRRRW